MGPQIQPVCVRTVLLNPARYPLPMPVRQGGNDMMRSPAPLATVRLHGVSGTTPVAGIERP